MSDRVTVNVQTGAGEILRIVATLLLFGGASAIAWSVAQGQNAEVAATGMTLFIVMLCKLMWARGMIALPAGTGGADFEETKGTARKVADEYRAWLAGTSMPALTLIAIGYALAFLVLRAGVASAFNVFSNLYIAGGVGAMVGAIVVFPSLLPSMVGSLRRKGVVTDQGKPQRSTTYIEPQAPVQPQQQYPYASPQQSQSQAPVGPQPQVQPQYAPPAGPQQPQNPYMPPASAPASQPAAAAPVAPKKVVRRVKKVNKDV